MKSFVRSKKLNLFYIAAVALSLVATPVSAGIDGIDGGGQTGVQVQNLAASDTTVNVSLYPTNGSAAKTLATNTAKKDAAVNYYMPSLKDSSNNDIPAGTYAMVASASAQVGAIARTDWSTTGGAAIYGSVAPGKSILVPLVVSKFAGQISTVSVQNTNTSADVTDVKLTLFARGSATAVKTLTNQTIAKGTSKSWKLDDTGVWGTLPDSATDLGTTGFVGSLLIESATDLVAASLIDIGGTPGVTAFNGVPSNSAASTLFCPLVRANFYGDTGIQIVNNNGTEANVTITFRADPASPKSGTFTQSIKVGANSSNIAFQGPTGNSRSAPTNLPGGTQSGSNTTLTNDGFFGSAVLVSDQPIVAVVNDTEFGAGFSVKGQSTFNCVAASSAGKTHYLPLLRRFHLNSTKLTTGVQVLNVTGSAGTATLSLVNFDGNDASAPDPAAKNMGANGAANFFGGDWTGLPTVPANLGGSGWFGSGKITCSQDCIVIVSDEGFGATKVDRANYIGILQ